MKQKRYSLLGNALLVVGMLVILGLFASLYDLWRRRDILAERSAILRRLEAEKQVLSEERSAVESIPFVERLAREKLGLVKEGEAIVLMQQTNPRSMATRNATGEDGQQASGAIWRRWWSLFF